MEDREVGFREEVGSLEVDVIVCFYVMLRIRL